MQLCRLWMLVTVFPLLLKPIISRADGDQATIPLDEEFLLFLAEGSVFEGETIDPLSMLDIENEELGRDNMIEATTVEQTLNEKDTYIMNTKLPVESAAKEDQ